MKTKLIQTKDYLLLTDEKAEININDYWIYLNSNEEFDEIITKSNLTEREWYSKLHDRFAYKKVIAYYPLNSEAKELDLPLLPNPFEEVDIEKLAFKTLFPHWSSEDVIEYTELAMIESFVIGYKAAQQSHSKQFSLEDMEEVYYQGRIDSSDDEHNFDNFIQSLPTQQLSKGFVPEYEYYYHSSKEFYKDAKFEKCSKEQYELIKEEIPSCPVKVELKTMTNSEGREELVGIYKY